MWHVCLSKKKKKKKKSPRSARNWIVDMHKLTQCPYTVKWFNHAFIECVAGFWNHGPCGCARTLPGSLMFWRIFSRCWRWQSPCLFFFFKLSSFLIALRELNVKKLLFKPAELHVKCSIFLILSMSSVDTTMSPLLFGMMSSCVQRQGSDVVSYQRNLMSINITLTNVTSTARDDFNEENTLFERSKRSFWKENVQDNHI